MLDAAPFLCIAHRGASAEAPENTLAAFRRARALGAHGVELDVHCCEGTLVVIHDDELERTTSGRGRVSTSTLADLSGLDAGSGERIPQLKDVLDTLGPDIGVNVELKGANTAAPTVALLGALAIAPERILLSAFDHAELHEAARLAPQWPRAALFARGAVEDSSATIAAASAVGARSINIAAADADAMRIAALRRDGHAVLVYTVNDPAQALEMRAAGASGVFTDDPGALLAALRDA